MNTSGPQLKVIFLISQQPTYVVGTQKNRLNDGSFEQPKLMFKPDG